MGLYALENAVEAMKVAPTTRSVHYPHIKTKADLEREALDSHLAICIEYLAAHYRMFRREMREFNNRQTVSRNAEVAARQAKFQTITEYQFVMKYGSEQQKLHIQGMLTGIAQIDRSVREPVSLELPTVKRLERQVAACRELIKTLGLTVEAANDTQVK